ncbi:energy-coupling factor transporter transmembrane component T family protein [Paenibacillus senegalensis]|uniref:energy-coupling factor transporter transmembrane component T family protein n=1 Tax=Paenibacillus senegalensis TaxID=1465766 RepID=UPI000288ED7C|nr:energy-coupling factor transporter transmembrane component T [Paenibacillus senegalensis]
MSCLHRLNPLAKLLAIGPPAVFLALTTNVWTPLSFILLTIAVTIMLGNISLLRYAKVCAPMLLIVLSFMLLYPLLVSDRVNEGSQLWFSFGFIEVYEAGVLFGLATGLRLFAMLVLSLLFTLTTDTTDFVRALIQQWKVSYRFGFGALAVLRFVPVLIKQFQLVKMAHQVRGYTGKGSRKYIERIQRYALPLLSSALRHAERAAYSMDSRAFGAYRTRTYFRRSVMVKRDLWFIAAFWAVSGLTILILFYCDMLGELSLFKTYH